MPVLVEAARAGKGTADRFVPHRTGILEEAAARRHQFIFGRRGVGKSTLLRKIESQSLAPDSKVDVMFVDIETLRGRPYPDVLIELLIEILDGLVERLGEKGPRIDLRRKRRRAKKRLRELSGILRGLRDEPQTAQRMIRRQQLSGHWVGFDIGVRGVIGKLLAAVRAGASRASRREESIEATVEEPKMFGLQNAVVLIRGALAEAQSHLDGKVTLLVLDDFYHIPLDAQPEVLAYLHQIVKNLEIFLKVCSVKHRIRPFVEGDPPCGLQPGQDAGEVSLDITLERFREAKIFLEKILESLCEPLGIKVSALITEGGRRRLIIGSGGVARDYLNLTRDALRVANERTANQTRFHNRISAEDVNEAADKNLKQKEAELNLDASADGNELQVRLADLVKFCLDYNKTNMFTVDSQCLREEDWGKEIQALADLRLLHQVGTFSDGRGTSRARNVVGFTLDLGKYVGTRSESIRQVEFWTQDGKQALRAAQLVYTPGASQRLHAIKHQAERDPVATQEAAAEWESELASTVPPATG